MPTCLPVGVSTIQKDEPGAEWLPYALLYSGVASPRSILPTGPKQPHPGWAPPAASSPVTWVTVTGRGTETKVQSPCTLAGGNPAPITVLVLMVLESSQP